ncbi:hypothetical protein [Nitrosococcus wardiae]|uniref:Uncharacterized protein n=1 Tax=Nitrosococcus wardiae TaxID=1814290 RepID=A0A4P7C0Z0_9GAMM|nr:hypothetical protein [Nitrosococcus wardiae]QBQ55230.1 hypothetical protein E3U44_12440 [Nitrosococcus wardiae]
MAASIKKRTETESQKIAKERIVKLYNEYKKKKNLEGVKVTQSYVAERMSVERSLISGELGTHAPIGPTAAERWAKFFGIAPWEIHPDIEKPYTIDKTLMEILLREVIDLITIAHIVSLLYMDCKKQKVSDPREIREKTRLALLFSK